MPKVSVCIPAYNQIKYLQRTIDSVLEQNFTDYEIIITDDSSSTIVNKLIDHYNLPHIIRYYKNLEQLGTPENWNEAIRKASGEYIKLLHHDDWLNGKNSLEKYVALLDNNPEVDFAFSATYVKSPHGENREHLISKAQYNELPLNPLYLFENNIIGAPSTTILRRNAAMLFDPKLKWQVDKENYIRQLTVNNKIAYSNELLVITFLPEGRVTNECINNKEIEIFEYFYVLDKIIGRRNSYSSTAIRACMLKVISVCKQYKIKGTRDIRDCGYQGHIPLTINAYLLFKKISPFIARVYLKIFRTI